MIFKFSHILVAIVYFFSSISFAQKVSDNIISNNKKYFVSDLQKQIDVLHYHLSLDLNIEEKILSGTAKLTATKNPTLDLDSELELNLYDNLIVSSIKVNGTSAEYSRSKNRLFIKSEEVLSDTFEIEIVYSGTPKKSGFDGFVFGEVNGQSLVYNISEPIYAPTWFPCDDDPSDKALLDIEITNDSQFVSVSNGNLIGC